MLSLSDDNESNLLKFSILLIDIWILIITSLIAWSIIFTRRTLVK